MNRLDPELVQPLQGFLEATGGGFNLADLPALRAGTTAMLQGVNAQFPVAPGLSIEDQSVPSNEPGVDVAIRVYRPAAAAQPLPALVWMHPGGFVIGSVEMDELMARSLALEVGCVIVSVDYRLAPEHPFPAALEDCYGVLSWLSHNAAALGVDPARIAIGGASGGGGLAAGLALMARDRTGPKPIFQWLFYPALDDANIELASASMQENLFWSRANARAGWQHYLQNQAGSNDVSAYAAPIRSTDLTGVADAFIGVGSVDMLLAENITYAERLSAAGSKVQLAVYPGACHAFDVFAADARVTRRFVAERVAALKNAFAK